MCGMTRKSFLTEGSAPQVTVPHSRLWAWTHKPSVNSSVGTLDVSSPSLWDFATNLPCVIGFVFPTPFSIFLPLENDSFVVKSANGKSMLCLTAQMERFGGGGPHEPISAFTGLPTRRGGGDRK